MLEPQHKSRTSWFGGGGTHPCAGEAEPNIAGAAEPGINKTEDDQTVLRLELPESADALNEFVCALQNNFEHYRDLFTAAAEGGDVTTAAARLQRTARIEEVMQGVKRPREEKSATSTRLWKASRRLSEVSCKLSREMRSSTELEMAAAHIEEALASIEKTLASIDEAPESIKEKATNIQEMNTRTSETTVKKSSMQAIEHQE